MGEGVGGERLKEIKREEPEDTRRDGGNDKRESCAGHMLQAF